MALRVIVLGTDHHNTLAAIRAFGREHYDIILILHGIKQEYKDIKITKSKYVRRDNVIIVGNQEDEILNAILSVSNRETTVLFPTSDLSAVVVDKNRSTLIDSFICPHFCDKNISVERCMDKWEQYLMSKSLSIPVPNTTLIKTSAELESVVKETRLPCIVKPRVSAYGSKMDISICNNYNELIEALIKYRDYGYEYALIQDYIEKKYELNSFGCFFHIDGEDSKYKGGIIYKIREQIENATSYGIFIMNERLLDEKSFEKLADSDKRVKIDYDEYIQLYNVNSLIMQYLSEHRYQGFYDIDYIIADNCVYLIEINFRQGGNSYALLENDNSLQVDWVKSCIDYGSKSNFTIKTGSYLMMEIADLPNIKNHAIQFNEWIHDAKRASYYAIYSTNDRIASYRILWQCLSGMLVRNVRETLNRFFHR